MKKILTILFLALSTGASAQVYEKGSKFVNAGVGLGPGVGGIVSVDLGIHEAVSAGIWGGYQTWGLTGALKYGQAAFGGRADLLSKKPTSHLTQTKSIRMWVHKLELATGRVLMVLFSQTTLTLFWVGTLGLAT